MATAPTPGAGRRAEVAKRILRISDGKRTLDLQWANLGPREDRLVRKEAGFSLPQLMEADSFDSFALAVIWWITRVRAGEDDLSFDDVLTGYPTYEHFAEFTVEQITPDEVDGHDPEG